jgi:hypothetical protein
MLTNQLPSYCSVSLVPLYKESDFEITSPLWCVILSAFLSPFLSIKLTSSAWFLGTLALFYGMRCFLILEWEIKPIKIAKLNRDFCPLKKVPKIDHRVVMTKWRFVGNQKSVLSFAGFHTEE